MAHPGVDVQAGAHKALLQILEALADFVIESGLSANDFNAIFREALVNAGAKRHLATSDRVNVSGIAAITGIPRAEISRILNARKEGPLPLEKQFQSTNRILAAWHEDPKFTNPNGQPAELKLYGRGLSFESLVRLHGSGIPMRAILDELLRVRAVELLPSQRLRARSSVGVERGMAAPMIKEFGARSSELIATLLANMRDPERSRFVATTASTAIRPDMLPLFRKELAAKGSAFLSDVQEALPTAARAPRGGKLPTISVTVFMHESQPKPPKSQLVKPKRRNFSRRRVKP